ncbi:hypothetical protein BXT84_10865 [Sulfobacillus thermotolerans]|uniref:Bacterial Ig-like domain-containing protein n=1 Tax=Sulfobacillus thermotolerans TaxID=338644 RepID=A0ABN5H120_9FIRM|nr:hypothetical protein BXT84_10865 [Sulfobacillus thermotolerans]
MRTKNKKTLSRLMIGAAFTGMALFPVSSVFAAPAGTVSITETERAPAPGGSDTFTATSTNIPNVEYQFWVEQDNTWRVAQNWSPSRTVTLRNLTKGSYLMTVYAAPKGQYLHPINTTPEGTVPVVSTFVNSAVTVTGPASINEGQAITLSAQATNISPVLYQFWYETPSGVWKASGNYSSANHFTFTAAQTGVYRYIAYAKMPDAIDDAQGAGYSAVGTTQSQPAIEAKVPKAANISTTPIAITASFDQNGSLVASENIPLSDYNASTQTASFLPPSTLAAGTYTVTVLFEMSNANFVASPEQTYTQQ